MVFYERGGSGISGIALQMLRIHIMPECYFAKLGIGRRDVRMEFIGASEGKTGCRENSLARHGGKISSGSFDSSSVASSLRLAQEDRE
jgi:hypothetical protein